MVFIQVLFAILLADLIRWVVVAFIKTYFQRKDIDE